MGLFIVGGMMSPERKSVDRLLTYGWPHESFFGVLTQFLQSFERVSMRIGIVGAGWYGCHLALVLKRLGHEVDIYEAGDDVLQLASVNNQSRLHLGYHYPRCATTRLQTVACFPRFMAAYPSFSKPVEHNIYAVSNRNSLIDYYTYCQIMAASGLRFDHVKPADYGLVDVEGAIAVDERTMDYPVARQYFRQALGSSLHLNSRVAAMQELGEKVIIQGEAYDVAINCTWCALGNEQVKQNLFFEPTILLYYEATEPFYGALTLMDGPCFSIYPYDETRYTLSHVACTARGHFNSFAEAKAYSDAMTEADIAQIRQAMTDEVVKEFPSFTDRFRYLAPQFSMKTKYDNSRASRDTAVARHGNILTVLSGKIDTIFIAEDRVLAHLANWETGNPSEELTATLAQRY